MPSVYGLHSRRCSARRSEPAVICRVTQVLRRLGRLTLDRVIGWLAGTYLWPMPPRRHQGHPAKLVARMRRRWRVILLRGKGQLLGEIEALVAYRSQFQGPDDRAHAGQARVKSRLIGDCDPNEWDLPPKPKWMRWHTYKRHVERYDAYEDILDEGTFELMAKLLGRSA